MDQDTRRPPEVLLNMRFRLEIDGLPGTGATEVVLPDARLAGGTDGRRGTEYGTLTIRRGVTGARDWFEWWDRSRTSPRARDVVVSVLDGSGRDAARWKIAGAAPLRYAVSPLHALGSEPLIETLELSVQGVEVGMDD